MNKEINNFLKHFPSHVIQYFPDVKDATSAAAKTVSKLDIKEQEIMQNQNCGVYFSVNGFKDGSRKIDNLVNTNGVYVDLDIGKEGDVYDENTRGKLKNNALDKISKSPLKPHFVIETKNGYQVIWLTKNVRVDNYTCIEEGLIKYFGADKGAKDICRVLRLPKSLHLKNPDRPFECKLVHDNSSIPKYTEEEIIGKFNIKIPDGQIDLSKDIDSRSREIQSALMLPITEVIKYAGGKAGYKINFKENGNGTKQIVENGEITSGFISENGEYCKSMSGKKRNGNQITVAEYYLNKIAGNNYNRQQIAELLISEVNQSSNHNEIIPTPVEVIELSNFLKMDIEQPGYLIEDLLPDIGLSMISGNPGVYKTWLYLYFVYCIVNDKLVFGKHEVKPVNTLLINLDDLLCVTHNRLKVLGFKSGGKGSVYVWRHNEFIITGNKGLWYLNKLSEHITKHKVKLVVIDTLRLIHDKDENVSDNMRAVMVELKKISNKHNTAILLVHHDRKSDNRGGNIASVSGSVAITANLISSLHVKAVGAGTGVIRIERGKGKLSKAFKPITVKFQDEQNGENIFKVIETQPKLDLDSVKVKIKQFYDDSPAPGLTKDDVVKKISSETEVSKHSVKTAFEDLVENKYLKLDDKKQQYNKKIYIKNS